MTQGLAIWHYPHRTIADNIRYFAAQGFEAVSAHGAQLVQALLSEQGASIAEALRQGGVQFTVHYTLPKSHAEEHVATYKTGIETLAAWQNTYGLIKILSFDVPAPIRDGIASYVDIALAEVQGCFVAVEDFGLTPEERAQIEHLKENPRFGYLLDIGHMFIRLSGKNTGGKPLFTNRADECPASENPGYSEFMRAMASKEFPVFEMHLHKNDGEKDLHWFLEEGALDIPMIARVVRNMGFDGIMTIESAPGFRFECRGADADEGIMKTFDYWKECCKKKCSSST